MNIEHFLVFHGFTKAWTPKRKDHAQDCETLTAKASRPQYPAILPWSLCFEWRPSFRWYGHLTRYAQLPDCCWTLLRMICSENRRPSRIKSGTGSFGIMHPRGRYKSARLVGA